VFSWPDGPPAEAAVLPQLARPAKTLPTGDGWVYEPKWDGFRMLAFVDGGDVYLQSRSGKPMTRYFPELRFPEGRYVLDGEVVLFDAQGRQDFDALGQRIHPAESRIRMLAEQTPTRFIAFDLLADGDDVLLELPQAERRDRSRSWSRSPSTSRPRRRTRRGAAVAAGRRGRDRQAPGRALPARRAQGHGQDQAHPHDRRRRRRLAPGQGGEHRRLADPGPLRRRGELRTVGHTSGLSAKRKRELVEELKPYETGERGMGDPSRWANDRDLEWVALRPELVVEVTFDHTSNDRIRHGTKLSRWRDDKAPAECRMEQLAG
jgi:ATP-dependent DNA ligase